MNKNVVGSDNNSFSVNNCLMVRQHYFSQPVYLKILLWFSY